MAIIENNGRRSTPAAPAPAPLPIPVSTPRSGPNRSQREAERRTQQQLLRERAREARERFIQELERRRLEKMREERARRVREIQERRAREQKLREDLARVKELEAERRASGLSDPNATAADVQAQRDIQDQLRALQEERATKTREFNKWRTKRADELKRADQQANQRRKHDKAWQGQIEFLSTEKGREKIKERLANLGVPTGDGFDEALAKGRVDPLLIFASFDTENSKNPLSDEQVALVRRARTRVRSVTRQIGEDRERIGPLGIMAPDGSLVPFAKDPDAKKNQAATTWEEEKGGKVEMPDRMSYLSEIYRTINPYFTSGGVAGGQSTWDDVYSLLKNDPDIRFKDSKGRTHKKNGELYTLDDYTDSDTYLEIDDESIYLRLGNQTNQSRAALQAVTGEKVTKTGQVRMSGIDIANYYVKMQRDDPEKFIDFQRRLYDAGFYMGDPYAEGIMDETTQAAISGFIANSTVLSSWNNYTLDDILDQRKGVQAIYDGWDGGWGGGGGGGGGGASAWAVTDEAALNMIADSAGQSLLGRNLTDSERATVISQIKNLENTEGQKTSGAVQSIDPQARAEDILREMYPDDTKAHDMAGAFDMFAGILSAGLGLGEGGFGQSTVPTGTGGPVAPTGMQ